MEYIHGGDVGEVRHDQVGQFGSGLVQVECGADARGGVGDHGEAVAGLVGFGPRAVAVGDVDDGSGNSQDPSAGVLEPVQGHRPGVVVLRVRQPAADQLPVQDGLAGFQDAPHHLLCSVGVDAGQDLPGCAAQVLLSAEAVDAGERRVDRRVPQIRVEDGNPDGRLLHEAHGQGQIALHCAQRALVARQTEGVDVAEIVQQAHVAEFQQTRGAVLVPHGKDPGPALAGGHHLLEQVQDEGEVFFGDQQAGCVLAKRLLRGVAEELLGLGAPEDDAPLGIQDDRGNVEDIQQTARG